MKNFFQSSQYTEMFTEHGEVWVFGDTPENITEETPCQYVGRDTNWGDGTEETMAFPIVNGHGNREEIEGRVYVGNSHELSGTTAEAKISNTYNFNI